MAGDWIKIEHATPDKPEVFSMAVELSLEPDEIVGKLIRVWIWADQQTVDGNCHASVRFESDKKSQDGVFDAMIDRIVASKGFAEAMRNVGWMCVKNGKLTLPNFDRHNGQPAKKRANDQKRKAKTRHASVRFESDKKQTREEKRRVTPIVPKGTFELFWKVVHRKVGIEAARKAFPKAVKRVEQSKNVDSLKAADWLVDRMTLFAASDQAKDEIKGSLHPATWLNQGRYDDDESTWNRTVSEENYYDDMGDSQ